MGPVDEAGQTARSIVNVFKDQPIALGLLIINIALLLLLWQIAEGVKETRQKEWADIQKSQEKVQELLSRCVVPKSTALPFKVQPMTLPLGDK